MQQQYQVTGAASRKKQGHTQEHPAHPWLVFFSLKSLRLELWRAKFFPHEFWGHLSLQKKVGNVERKSLLVSGYSEGEYAFAESFVGEIHSVTREWRRVKCRKSFSWEHCQKSDSTSPACSHVSIVTVKLSWVSDGLPYLPDFKYRSSVLRTQVRRETQCCQ